MRWQILQTRLERDIINSSVVDKIQYTNSNYLR